MFENSNKDVLRELSQDNYRSHKMRNRLAILAVILTTILITAVLTVGISVTSTILNYGESAPGPGSIGSITGTEETRDQIRRLPHVVHADYIEKCSSAPLRNQEFSGMSVYLMAAERFRARPGDCVVIEDSAYAIRTAREAGFWTIGVYEPEMQDADLARSFCHQFVNNLGEIRPGYLET